MSTPRDKGKSKNPRKTYEITPSATDTISSLSFCPRANILVATSWDNQVRCWEVSHNEDSITNKPYASFSHDHPVLCSTWKDDGSAVFTGGCDKQAKMWSGDQAVTVAMHDAPIKEIAWISGINVLVTGSWDKTLKYWDLRQSNPVHTQQLPDKCYALSVKENLMVVGTADNKMVVFDVNKPQTEFKRNESLLPYQTKCLAAFPDLTGFLVGSIGGKVGVHHLDDAKKSKNYTLDCQRLGNIICTVTSLNFHPIHGSFSTTGSDGTYSFWDKDIKTRLRAMPKCKQPITCSTFNHNGSIFAYAIGYDWSKGAENHKPDTAKTRIFLHLPEERDVKAKSTGRFKVTEIGGQ